MSKHQESEHSDHQTPDLEPGRLRDAVIDICQSQPPAESVERAIQQSTTTIKAAVAVSTHAESKRGRRRYRWTGWMTAIVVLCMLPVVGMIGQSLRESARRTQVTNQLKQIGLAVHNYTDPVVANHWALEGSRDFNGRFLSHSNSDAAWYSRTSNEQAASVVRFHTSMPGEAVSKVIHSASLVLVVAEINNTDEELRKLVDRFDGSMGNSSVSEPQGQPRTANWVVRIPVEERDEFLSELTELGTPENRTTNANDVTEEFVDLQTRIHNKKQLEKRILELLETNTGEIKDVLAVEEQLARIREEIERMEGRVKRINFVTAMTTVSISAREQHDFVPPQAPTFDNEMSQMWQDSVTSMADLGKSILIVAIAVTPWLPLIMIVGLILWRLMRRRKTST